MRLRSFIATAVIVAGLIPNLGCGASTSTTIEQGNMEPIKPEADAKEIENGLKFKDSVEGTGEPAKPGNKVTVHYTGLLAANGKKFDSSLDRGTPFSVELGSGQVIKGWDKGLVGMKVGTKRRLYIPSEMAYGKSARGAVIPANSDLVFDVEMKEITGRAWEEIKVPADAVKTPSGLKYVDTKIGTGEEAKSGNKVTVHYTGMLQKNGKKFDSSLDSGSPFSFGLGRGQVIKGWDEGVAGMKEGGKRTLYIPSELGYGSRGAGGDIPPGADLVFEVEMIKAK